MKTLRFFCGLGLALAPILRGAERPPAIVVTPVIYGQPQIRTALVIELGRVFGVQVAATVENRELTAFIVDRLVNARKFTVLERARLDTVTRELEFGESDYADPKKAAKLGQMLNADYVLVPEIRHCRVRETEKAVPYLNADRTELEAVLGLSSRIVDVKTGQILASRIGDVRLKARARKDRPDEEAVAFVEALHARCADDLVGRVLDAVFPITVLEVAKDRVLVNRGEDFLQPGQRFQLCKTGRDLVDPDTGRALGKAESVIGAVEIVSANARISEARVLESSEPAQAGFVLRALPREPAPGAPARNVNW